MATPSRFCSALGCKVEIPDRLQGQGLCLDHYMEAAFQKLDLAADKSRSGEKVDRNTLDWLLVQVDCIVETVCGETPGLDPGKHSKLLDLLLGIANLNECVRHQMFATRHSC
jgi:hypothetical protein